MNLRPLTPAPPPEPPEPTDMERARLDAAERVLALTTVKLGTHVAADNYGIFTDHNGEQVEVPTHALDTIRHIVRPVCGDHHERTEDLIRTALSTGQGLTVTWLTIRTEWAFDDSLYDEQFDAIADGDGYLHVRQHRDGSYIVTAHESHGERGDIVRLVLPATFVYDLALGLAPSKTSDLIAEIRDVIRYVTDLKGDNLDRTPIGVAFRTNPTEYDDGYFLDHTGEVLFSDATTDEVAFGDAGEHLARHYGNVGTKAVAWVDLIEGTITRDDDAFETIHAHFNQPAPQ
jgi:hypothetical protein